MLAGVAALAPQGHTIGLVPTMGALHAGHMSLVERARSENARSCVSIFVNPIQFGPNEDLATLSARPRSGTCGASSGAGVDAVFTPVGRGDVPARRGHAGPGRRRDRGLEGAARPGHFEGVATVVAKLFWAAEPDRAYFGQKDAQQVAVRQAPGCGPRHWASRSSSARPSASLTAWRSARATPTSTRRSARRPRASASPSTVQPGRTSPGERDLKELRRGILEVLAGRTAGQGRNTSSWSTRTPSAAPGPSP